MKGLIKTVIIIAALIVAGIVTSIIFTSNLNNRVAVIHERGFEEGRAQGYEVGFYEGSKAGYQEGSKLGYERPWKPYYSPYYSRSSDYGTGFYFTYNPTYDELQAILAEGKKHDGKKNSAIEINYYAEAHGIRTAYVRCQIARKTTERTVYVYHLVAFETVDKGFIFIRPRSHEEIKVEVGKSYSELNGFPTPSYDDTITKITIYW